MRDPEWPGLYSEGKHKSVFRCLDSTFFQNPVWVVQQRLFANPLLIFGILQNPNILSVLSTMSASTKSIQHVWGEKLPKTSSLSLLVIYGQKHYPPLLNWSWDFLKSRLCSSKGKPGWNYRQRWNSTVSAISDVHSSVRLKKKSEHLDETRICFIKESVS